ncbi:hypothetical protein [Leptospira stimsonii]|uniref:Uncharacterized protein n=1 Tax=Leptospira stimsonii TaxID=2202203 RepID=A0A396YQK9_9LEPT|nr:hypothetical protein [Leptospira stimsonii]RHX83614.1 hypothetical protein DLM75_23920 [Leptospira stimsonii]
MKIVYLDQNIYGEFISKKDKLCTSLYDKLCTLVKSRKIIVPFSVSHIQETKNRANAESIKKELSIINKLSQGMMLYSYGKNCTVVFNDAYNVYENLQLNELELAPEFQEALRIYERNREIFHRIGFGPLVMNNKSYEDISKELNQILQHPEKYSKKITPKEIVELKNSGSKILSLLCSGSIRLLQQASSDFKELRVQLKTMTRNHLRNNSEIEDLFELVKPEYVKKSKEYRNNINKCRELIDNSLKMSLGIFPESPPVSLSSHSELIEYFTETLSMNKQFQFQTETVMVSIIEMAGYYPDSEKRKREVKKKGFFLELFDMPHFNNSLFCDFFITNDRALVKRTNAVLKHLDKKSPKILFPVEANTILDLLF